jgi:predicted lysophospholipase L1 biosynthesis ABC-type transport system permease subunit
MTVNSIRPLASLRDGFNGIHPFTERARQARSGQRRGNRKVKCTERQVEVAVRSALGASRGRLASQLVVESVVLAILGGAAGTLLAVWSVDPLLQWIPGGVLPRTEEVVFGSSVFWFSMDALAGDRCAVRLAPAFQAASSSVVASLRDASRTSVGRRGNTLRGMLMVAEVALALVLLVGAGLTSSRCGFRCCALRRP